MVVNPADSMYMEQETTEEFCSDGYKNRSSEGFSELITSIMKKKRSAKLWPCTVRSKGRNQINSGET